MKEVRFTKGFLWGAATSSYQIEGAWNEDGKGESLWDYICHNLGIVASNDTGDIACDHYHRYKEDVALMKEMNLKAYRFSISWPRIFPTGRGDANQKGVDFYDRLIDELWKYEIEPVVTLYHWDLPLDLQSIGGWTNPEVVEAFVEYAKLMFNHFGDRVKMWITFNEPQIFTLLYYSLGFLQEGIPGGFQASHLVNVSHAKAVQEYRQSAYSDGKIGITLNLNTVYPKTGSDIDGQATKIVDSLINRWFLDPVLKGSYPMEILKVLQQKFNISFLEEDLSLLRSVLPMDFLGVNNYSCNRVGVSKPEDLSDIMSFLEKYFSEVIVGDEKKEDGREYSEMGWEICPDGFYDLLINIDRDYGHPLLYITENGAACKDDRIIDQIVHDDDRISYLKRYLKAANRAINKGVNLRGYFVWSFLDNFEWLHGYSKRFGLIRVNYETQERIWKKSARWYRDVIQNNGFMFSKVQK
ncbi:MAG: GH1 family beta-glucosidase [Promethearchaeota archaeon]